ncbi:hypothetical protein ABKV19_026091, partial [Rosa sericea]
IWNSELSKFPSISDLGETKKMLGQCDHNQNSASATTHKSRRSKRWRTVYQQQTAEASHSFCGNDERNSAVIANKDLLVGTASHIDNSIMGDVPSNTVSRRTKRMLRQCDRAENYASTNVFFTSDESHRVASRNSKRWKAVFS